MYEIIDNNGTIHSGSEEEMRDAWEAITSPVCNNKELIEKYYCEWEGDLKLVHVLQVTR